MGMLILCFLFLFFFFLFIAAREKRISKIELYRLAEKVGKLRQLKETENLLARKK